MTTAFPGRKLYHAIRKSREHPGRGMCIPGVLNFSFDTERRPAATPAITNKCPSFHLHYFVTVNCQGALSWPFSLWITYDTPRKIYECRHGCVLCALSALRTLRMNRLKITAKYSCISVLCNRVLHFKPQAQKYVLCA